MLKRREGSVYSNSVALRCARSLRVAGGAASVALLLALSACAPHPRYTPIYCVSPDQLQRLKAAEPPRVGEKLTGQAQDDFKIAAGSAVELRSYAHGLLGVLEGCVEPKVSTIGDK